MQKRSIHSYAWIKICTPEAAALIAEKAAANGFNHAVIPMRDHATIHPQEIARVFGARKVTPVVTATQLPDADLSSLDPDIPSAEWSDHLRPCSARPKMPRRTRAVRSPRHASRNSPPKPNPWASGATEILNCYETSMFNTVDDALAFLKMSGSDNLFLHLDTFHMNIKERDMLAALKRAFPHLVYFELDQNDRGLLDKAAIDVGPMLTFLKENG